MFFRSTSKYICKWREIFQPVRIIRRLVYIVVKKNQHDGFLLRSSSAYNCFNQEKNQPVRIIEPVHIIGT